MKYCTRCGCQIISGARFCTQCGTPIANGTIPVAEMTENSLEGITGAFLKIKAWIASHMKQLSLVVCMAFCLIVGGKALYDYFGPCELTDSDFDTVYECDTLFEWSRFDYVDTVDYIDIYRDNIGGKAYILYVPEWNEMGILSGDYLFDDEMMMVRFDYYPAVYFLDHNRIAYEDYGEYVYELVCKRLSDEPFEGFSNSVKKMKDFYKSYVK